MNALQQILMSVALVWFVGLSVWLSRKWHEAQDGWGAAQDGWQKAMDDLDAATRDRDALWLALYHRNELERTMP